MVILSGWNVKVKLKFGEQACLFTNTNVVSAVKNLKDCSSEVMKQ
jgi:hypothetical protein